MAQQGPAHKSQAPVVSFLARRTAVWCTHRRRSHLLLPPPAASPVLIRAPRRRPQPPGHSPPLSRVSPSSALSLPSTTERSSSPPLIAYVATASPSPLRHAQKLRHDFLVSSVKPQGAGRPGTSPSPSSPPAAADRHRRFVVSSASPATTSSPASPP